MGGLGSGCPFYAWKHFACRRSERIRGTKMQAKLCDPWGKERVIPLGKLPVVLERGHDAGIHVQDPWTSHHHCEISERTKRFSSERRVFKLHERIENRYDSAFLVSSQGRRSRNDEHNYPSDLTDGQWQVLRSLLPRDLDSVGLRSTVV